MRSKPSAHETGGLRPRHASERYLFGVGRFRPPRPRAPAEGPSCLKHRSQSIRRVIVGVKLLPQHAHVLGGLPEAVSVLVADRCLSAVIKCVRQAS